MSLLLLIPIIIIVVILISCICIVPQANAYVVEFLGSYKATWSNGLHFKVPFLERVAKKVSLKEQVADFPPQSVITKDNVTISVDSIVFFKIMDPKLYVYGVQNPILAIENLTATTLRNLIGDLELDQTLTSREMINSKLSAILDEATDPWGVKITRVELQNITPPAAIQEAMEKQMKAERERREAILKAEGEKKSTILVAEGEKESSILKAEADRQSTILKADAEKQKRIKEAEGQAEAIKTVQNATAIGIKCLKAAGADQSVLTLKSLETFAKVADGKATKIIIPSELQNIANMATTFTEIANEKIHEETEEIPKVVETVKKMEKPKKPVNPRPVVQQEETKEKTVEKKQKKVKPQTPQQTPQTQHKPESKQQHNIDDLIEENTQQMFFTHN